MTKKRIFLGLALLFTTYLLYLLYIFVLSPKTNLQSIYLIPEDAIFVLESEKPVDSWRQVSESKGWNHLKGNDYFAELTKNIQKVDTIFKDKRGLFEFFDGRSLFISIHPISKKDYGIFYVLDLKRIAKLKLLKTYLNTLLDEGYLLSKRTYHNHEILEIYDRTSKETMHLSFIENQLVASYTHALVEAAIDQFKEPKLGRDLNFLAINKKVGYEDLFRLYVQYAYVDDYYSMFSNTNNEWLNSVSQHFLFSGFSFDLDSNSTITADGYTNIRFENENYLEALQQSGTGRRSIAQIAPAKTALYLSYGFDSFTKFYENFERVQRANNSEQFRTYETSLKKVEKFLKISVKEQFVSWIGEEIALLQINSDISKSKNDIALVLQTTEISKAKAQLDFVVEQIRKKTPVRFKAIPYKGHEINFLSIKGFFKLFLGNRFKAFDKPYFTIISDKVIFSDSPNTLKNMINSYENKQTLESAKDFQDFNEAFKERSSVFAYINVPLLYDTFYGLANKATRQQLKRNRDYLICFPQMGLQLSPDDELFKSRLVVNYQDVAMVKDKAQFSNTANKDIPALNAASDAVDVSIFNLKPIYPTDLSAKFFSKVYPNGTLRFKVDLKDGLKHGRYVAYHSNGQKKITGRFKKDQQVGTWRYYDAQGKQQLKKRF